jgi:hypothetical protein
MKKQSLKFDDYFLFVDNDFILKIIISLRQKVLKLHLVKFLEFKYDDVLSSRLYTF